MSDSVWPHRWQPTRLPHPSDSPGKNTGVVCHFLLQYLKVKMKSLSRVRPSVTPWTAAFQAPRSMGFSRQEYWSGGAIALMLAIWSLVHLPFLKPLETSRTSWSHIIEPWFGEFWALFTSVWGEHNCVIVWTFFGIAFLWDWNESWPFPVLWPLLSFPNLLTYWVSNFYSIIF